MRPQRSGTTSRRAFLRAAGAGAMVAAGGPALLAACGGDGTRGGRGGAAQSQTGMEHLVPDPFHEPLIEPDIPGIPDWGKDGFLSQPDPLVQAFDSPPGSGGRFRVMVPLWGPLPPPLGRNSYYDAVNDALGATIEFNYMDGMEINNQMATLLAGGDVVDVTSLPGWALLNAPEFTRGVTANFEDLTPYLSGDISDRWPFLAGIPTSSWLACVFDGKLMATPSWPGPGFGWRLYQRRDILDEMGIDQPGSAEDLFEIAQEVNDPANGRWAFDDPFWWMREIFRVPDKWRLDDGELVHEFEVPEMEATLEYVRKLADNNLIHPDALGDAGETQELFKAGNIIFLQDGTGTWGDMLRDMTPTNPGFWMEPLPIFGHDGGDPLFRMSQDPTFTMIKKGTSEEKLEEILDILNFFSSPWGTTEERLFTQGVEGEHYQIDGDGNPERLDLGHEEIVACYEWLGGRVYGISGHSERYVQAATEWWNEAAQYRFEDLFLGIHVDPPARFKSAQQPMEDLQKDIVRGRAEVSDWADAVENWRRSGGDEGRDFYMQVLEDNDRA